MRPVTDCTELTLCRFGDRLTEVKNPKNNTVIYYESQLAKGFSVEM